MRDEPKSTCKFLQIPGVRSAHGPTFAHTVAAMTDRRPGGELLTGPNTQIIRQFTGRVHPWLSSNGMRPLRALRR